MKYNKKIIASILAASLCTGSFAFAAPAMTRNIGVNYNLKLKVNGQDYTVEDANQRPFKTNDGRAYVSVAALGKMGIATSTYADNTVTIKNVESGPSSSEIQSQLNAVIAQNNGLMTTNNNLMTENAKLKAEVESLSKKSSDDSKSSKNSNSSSKPFNDLSSSERRELEKDLVSDLKSLRADSDFQRSQRFEVRVSIDKNSVSLDLTPYQNWTADEVKSWNALMDKSSDYDRLMSDYEDFVEDVQSEVSSSLKKYKDFDVKLKISSTTNSSNIVVDGEYRSSKGKVYVDLYKAK